MAANCNYLGESSDSKKNALSWIVVTVAQQLYKKWEKALMSKESKILEVKKCGSKDRTVQMQAQLTLVLEMKAKGSFIKWMRR